MRLLFKDYLLTELQGDEDLENKDIIMVNQDRKIVVNPLEDFDEEEKLAILTDILNADPI